MTPIYLQYNISLDIYKNLFVTNNDFEKANNLLKDNIRNAFFVNCMYSHDTKFNSMDYFTDLIKTQYSYKTKIHKFLNNNPNCTYMFEFTNMKNI